LASALEDLDARIRTPERPEGVPFPHGGDFLQNLQILNLTTRFGDLDLAFRPAGTRGFSELEPRSVPMRIRDLTVAVAALEDVIRSKEAANRPKDQRSLPVLRQLLDEIRKRQE
jgi:hypothetical protein